MKTGKQTNKRTSLTERYRSTTIGRRSVLLMTAIVGAATLIFLFLVGPVAEPDFWQIEKLVSVGANYILFTCLVAAALSPIGYSWHIFLSGVEAAIRLSRVTMTALPPPQAYFSWLPTNFSPNNPSLSLARVNHQTLAIANNFCKRHPRLRSTNKAPFGLFMQAVSFFAP